MPSSSAQEAHSVLLCTRPPMPKASSTGSGGSSPSTAPAGLALLLLGHRQRLMFTTLPANVVAPVVQGGTPLTLFALLENSTMSKAFRGRRPMGNPALASLSDAQLATQLSKDVQTAGGTIGQIRIEPRPVARLPEGLPTRLSRYSEGVKLTVATRFLKESIGLRMVVQYEARMAARAGAAATHRFEWVLWTREDSHWFAPLMLHTFRRGAVHGKSCGGFGGWNDKVWLMDREFAEPMLSMYTDFHVPHLAKCTDLSARRATGGVGARDTANLAVDFLAAPSVEQFRERVGKLRRVPFVKHPPEALPTMDSYYTQRGDGSWRLCFPRIYADGCVPRANVSAVESGHTCDRKRI